MSSRTSLLGFAALLVCVVAVLWPCAVHGFPHGADADFHATAWSDVAQQWHQGTIWPRWGARFAHGYGEPVYVFYPPFSIALGAACLKIVGGGAAPIAFCFVTLLLAGWNMRQCARDFTDDAGAWIAACAYAANPYFLLCVWIRNSFAELLAAAIFPLVVKYAMRLDGRRDVARLSLAYAAMWFTNFPAAVIASYALVMLLAARSIDDCQWIRLGRGAAAVVLGGGIASWTMLPAWYEQRWVQIATASADYYVFWKHWLWGGGADPDDVDFTRWLTMVAVALIAVAVLAILARIVRRETFKDSQVAILVLALVSALLMFRVSYFVWAYSPLLSRVQFPWRWLFVLAFAGSLLVAIAIPTRRWKFAGAVLLLAGGIAMGNYIHEQTDWEDAWSNEYAASQQYAVDEYLPVGVDGDVLQQAAAQGRAGTLDYPAWKWDPQQAVVQDAETHLLTVKSGDKDVLHFTRTWDRTLGGALTIVSLLVCGCLFLPQRLKPVSTSN